MTASSFYRAAAVLLLLFAVGHTLGFRDSDPTWGIGPMLAAMQSVHFTIQGFTRTYWDFFVGTGFIVGVLYLFAAVLAWQLGGLPAAALARMRATTWAFAGCFAIITVLSVRHLFLIPIVMSALVTVCLGVAAWSSSRSAATAKTRNGSDSRGVA